MIYIKNKDFNNPNVFCFDLDQYKKNIKYLISTVFVNYKGEFYYTDIRILIKDHCKWNGSKWEVRYNLNMIKQFGLENLLTQIKNEEIKGNFL